MKNLFLFIGLFMPAVVPAQALFTLEKSNARERLQMILMENR